MVPKCFCPQKRAIAIENALGPDIMMSLDERPPFLKAMIMLKRVLLEPVVGLNVACRLTRILDWQALLVVVQGAGFKDLREQSAKDLVSMDFPGYSIGGCLLVNQKIEMNHVL